MAASAPLVTFFDPFIARVTALCAKLPAQSGWPLIASSLVFVACAVVPSFLLATIVEQLLLRAGKLGRGRLRSPGRLWFTLFFTAAALAANKGLRAPHSTLFVLGSLADALIGSLVVATIVSRVLTALFRFDAFDRARRRERFWIKILIAGAVSRVATLIIWRGPIDLNYSDAYRHYDNAKHFLDPGPQGCSNPYFYQLFLYLVLRFTDEAKLGVHLVNAVLSVSYPLIWYGFARTVLRRKVDALRFASVLMFMPTHTVMFSFFMNETVLLPTLGGAFWATSLAGKRRSGALFILASFLWVIAILTRSVVLPASIMALGWCLYRMRSRAVLALGAPAGAALAAVAALPVGVALVARRITLARVRALAGPVVAFLAGLVFIGSAAAASSRVADLVDHQILERHRLLPFCVAVGVVLALAIASAAIRPQARVVPLLAGWLIVVGGMAVAGLHSFKHMRRYTAFGDNTVVSVYFASGGAGYQIDYLRRGVYIFGSPSLYISPFEPFYEWRSSRWKMKCPEGQLALREARTALGAAETALRDPSTVVKNGPEALAKAKAAVERAELALKDPESARVWPKECEGKSPKERDAMLDTDRSTFKFTADPDKNGEDVKKTLHDVVIANRSILPRLVWENVLFTSFSHSWPDSGRESGPALICLWERWIWLPLFVACVSRVLLLVRRRRELFFVPVVAAMMVLALYASQITVMEGRYRKPVEPMVVLSMFWLAI
jgi:hypothetical protein